MSHSVYQHQYHIVWGTKWRRRWLKGFLKTEFERLMIEVVKKYPTLFIQIVNTDRDHVHLQIEIPPNTSVSATVKKLKWYTSIHLKKKFNLLKKIYIEGSIWSVGYFSSTVGLDEETVKRYVAYQGRRDVPRQVRLGFS